jgi:hypothetical protein
MHWNLREFFIFFFHVHNYTRIILNKKNWSYQIVGQDERSTHKRHHWNDLIEITNVLGHHTKYLQSLI